ncbi:MAG: sodium:solute symporter [Phycisphaerales bacterium]|nr:sodium:solute symporter [Phycisphaerales bacterium]
MNLIPESPLRLADGLVLLGYCALLVITGIWFARREAKNTNEYFLAARRMPMWAVAVSIIATSLSAATFIGAPEQSYAGDCTYLSTNIGGIIAVVIVAVFFIPAFYRHNCTTIYELLENRFGPGAKRAASAAFMVGRVFASGSRIYIGAIPFAMILFGTQKAAEPEYLIASIALMCVVGVVYTLVGGIASVIWTDVIQTIVLATAVGAAIVLLYVKIDMPIGEMWSCLSKAGADNNSKLAVLKTGFGGGFDPSAQFTLLTAVFGFALLNIASYGTDHDMVQRMLTCKNAVQGSRSVLVSMAIGIPIVCMFLTVGLLLYLFYNERGAAALQPFAADAVGGPAAPPLPEPPKSDKVFLEFILNHMPPGLAGLMLAGLFAAGIGSLISAINAMAATFIKDFYQRWCPPSETRDEKHYLGMSRWAVAGWGVILGLFAVGCVFWKQNSPETSLISLALGVMTFAYAGLLAVFCTALFTTRGSTRSVIAALLTGFIVIALLQGVVWKAWTGVLFGADSDIAKFNLAFPWHMTIGFALAFAACLLGKGGPTPEAEADRTPR